MSNEEAKKEILIEDSIFWQAYNSCDIKNMQRAFAEDVEFYHDYSGITKGLQQLTTLIQTNMCGDPKVKLTRKPKDTSQIFILRDTANSVYGAIQFVENIFDVSNNGKKPKTFETGKVERIWLFKDGVWKIQKEYSYDHQPVPYKNERKEIQLSGKELQQYAGEFSSQKLGVVIFQKDSTHLLMLFKNQKMKLFPETSNKFFSKEKDLTFEFQKNKSEQIAKVTVLEDGELVDEMTKK